MLHRIQRQVRQQRTDSYDDRFMGLACIPPTSVACERLFSQVKWGFNERRQRMHPETLEMLTMLREHRSLWSIEMLMREGANEAEMEAELEELVHDLTLDDA